MCYLPFSYNNKSYCKNGNIAPPPHRFLFSRSNNARPFSFPSCIGQLNLLALLLLFYGLPLICMHLSYNGVYKGKHPISDQSRTEQRRIIQCSICNITFQYNSITFTFHVKMSRCLLFKCDSTSTLKFRTFSAELLLSLFPFMFSISPPQVQYSVCACIQETYIINEKKGTEEYVEYETPFSFRKLEQISRSTCQIKRVRSRMIIHNH